jgi:hypothetical protein
MSKEYDLNNYGIESPVELIGSMTFLKFKKGLPTVFLFDEHHGNLNNCIDKNIVNAIELIEKGDVVLVGVESLAGGKEWDVEIEDYRKDEPNDILYEEFAANWRNNHTKFYDELSVNYEQFIRGVESIGMMDKIEVDLYKVELIQQSEAIKNHHLTKERSKHFLLTLFEIYNSNNLNGNIILNCGSDHNSHIEEWINDNQIDNITNFRANYIRINTID